ncbi:MAG TPA: hypothetical protein VEH82_08915 [Acidimicrobiales bacterium]|nr:hypothetical protein [Acidimicrobiales bacterium]
MRRNELKLVSGSDEAAPVDLAEILLAKSEEPSMVLRVVSSHLGEDEDPDDAA